MKSTENRYIYRKIGFAIEKKGKKLSDWVNSLLAKGKNAFSLNEVKKEYPVGQRH